MNPTRKILSAIFLIIVLFLVYSAIKLTSHDANDSRYVPSRWITLDGRGEHFDREGSSDITPDFPIKVAVTPVISPERSLVLFQWLADYLGAVFQRKVILIQRLSYGEVNDLIRHRACDIAFICSYPFVQAERDFSAELLVVPQINGKVTYKSYIIIPSTSTAVSLLYLRGKRFASSDILSNSGWLFPALWLLDRGEDPERFFQEHLLTGSHDRSVTAVATGYVDGAAVDSLVYEFMVREDPSLLEKTRIILKSPDFGMPPVVAHPKLDPALKKGIIETLTDMHKTQGGKVVLKKLGIDRFVIPDDRLYDGVREASTRWEAYR